MNQIEKAKYELDRQQSNYKLDIMKQTGALNQYVKFTEREVLYYGKVSNIVVDLDKKSVELVISIPRVPVFNGFGFWENLTRDSMLLQYNFDELDKIKSLFITKEEFENEYNKCIDECMESCKSNLNRVINNQYEYPKEVPALTDEIEKDIDESNRFWKAYKDFINNRP